jgi:diguanylate cyclase (GGDEF)-like protein/PAS domain S-box-containing protein
MFELDVRTLLAVTAMVSIGCSASLIVLWRSQSRRNGAGFWASGMCCLAMASLLITGRGYIPELFSVVFANVFYVIGFTQILRGIRIFAGRPPLLFFDYCLPPIAMLLFFYFFFIDNNINIRIVVLSAAFTTTCIAIAYTVLSKKKVTWDSAGVLIAVVFGLFGLLHGFRGVVAIFSPFAPSLIHSSPSNSLVFLGSIFILVAAAISLTMLTYAVLESELRILSHAINQSASSIVITNKDGEIEYVNPACIGKTGYSKEELVGENPRLLRSGKANPSEYKLLWEKLAAGETWRGEFHNRKKNGELFWEIGSIAPVKQKNGVITHYVAMKEDITALKMAEKRILHMANHDVLTGLPTRRLAMDRLVNSLALAKRYNTIVAVLYVDLDGFKAVNDTLNHEGGDHILKEASNRISACIRDVDTVSRVGGDEFMVILTNMPDKNSIVLIAEKLVKTISAPYQFEDVDNITIGASIGIALYPDNGYKPLELVNLADLSMYKVKRKGKNNYAFVNKMDAFDLAEIIKKRSYIKRL